MSHNYLVREQEIFLEQEEKVNSILADLETQVLTQLRSVKEEILSRFASWSLSNYIEIIEIVRTGNMKAMTNL
jgi:hypothetical protein